MAKLKPNIHLEKRADGEYYYFRLNANLFKDRYQWRIKDKLGNNLSISSRYIKSVNPIEFKKRLGTKDVFIVGDEIERIKLRLSEVEVSFKKATNYCIENNITDDSILIGRFLSEIGLYHTIKNKRKEHTTTIVDYIDLAIKDNTNPNTAKQWNTIKNILKYQFPKLTFNDIDISFSEEFKEVLLSSREVIDDIGKVVWKKDVYKLSSANKVIKTLNGFISKSFGSVHQNSYRIELIKDTTTSNLKTKTKLYLTETQIRKIYDYQVDDKDLEMVKDLFLCMCYTGMRVSDVLKLTPQNIGYNKHNVMYIYGTAQKTKKEYGVPCFYDELRQIINKYNGFPKVKSINFDVTINRFIKQICKNIPELNKPYKYQEDTGGGIIENKEAPIYELITNHTARRSFVSNNNGRYSIEEMKLFTGLSSDTLVEFYDKRKIVDKLQMYQK